MGILKFKPRPRKNPPSDTPIEQLALDALAIALVDHGHVWTDKQRKLYEDATRSFFGRKRA